MASGSTSVMTAFQKQFHPKKILMIENGDFGRVGAHEFGHSFGLDHKKN